MAPSKYWQKYRHLHWHKSNSSQTEDYSHLVTSSYILFIPVQVNTLGNVRRLLLKCNQHIASLVVKT